VTTPKALARTAGLLYLGLIALMCFAQMVVRDSVYVRDNAAATADRIRESADLYRIALAGDLIGYVCYLFLALTLYFLLRSHGPWAARTMLVIVTAATAILMGTLITHAGSLLVATDPGFASALGQRGSDALVLLFMNLQKQGYYAGQIFFGLWLLPLGLLVYRSGWFPKWLGVWLVIGGFGQLVELALILLVTPKFDESSVWVFLLPGGLSEVIFALWATIRGVNVRAPVGDSDPQVGTDPGAVALANRGAF
jgi:Domain of unknown function (DUF4386)